MLTDKELQTLRNLGDEAEAAAEEIAELREALTQYAAEDNWAHDELGIRRVWLEPDSTTRNCYNGYEAARKALKA
jgi:hypothetical protein